MIVESAQDFAIFTIDIDNQITSWNRGAKRVLGYSEAEAIGMSAKEIFTPDDRAKKEPEKEIVTARRKGRAQDERWHLRKGGSRLWGSGLMMPLRDDTERIVGYLKIFRDLTDRKMAHDALVELNHTLEERVRKRTAELEKSREELGELARQLTRTERIERERIAADLHDNLGQMLAMAQMKVSGISSSIVVDDEMAALAREVREYLDEAVAYTRALMSSLSPPGLGRGKLVAALKWLAADMAKYGLKVNFNDNGKPKPVSHDVQAVLFQAARELLFNVRKHSGVSSARMRIRVAGESVRIEVSDAGVGMAKNKRGAKDARRRFGLAHVGEQVRLFGGTIETDARRKRGAKVVISIPLERARR